MPLNVWTQPSGHPFGTFQERSKLSIDLPVSSSAGINFKLISGELPPGLRVAGAQIVGTPFEVPRTTTYKFCIRASANTGIADRTFFMDIAGPDAPTFLTAAGDLPIGPGQSYFVLDSSYVEFQISAIDFDTAAGQRLTFFIGENDGELPPGLSLSDTGLISGFVEPALAIKITDGSGAYGDGYYDNVAYDFGSRPSNGYNSFLYDQLIFDYSTPTNPPKKLNRNYEFIITLSDGDTISQRKFRIFVVADDFFRADNTLLPAGTGIYKADGTFLRAPVWKTPAYLGVKRANNYITEILDVYEPLDGSLILYMLEAEVLWAANTMYAVGAKILYLNKTYLCLTEHTSTNNFDITYWQLQQVPPGMQFDISTGELFGLVPYQPAVTTRYTFTVTATHYSNVINEVAVTNRTFILDLQGEIDSTIKFTTNSVVGSIPANYISNLRVDAVTTVANATLIYNQTGGRLPPGLSLKPDGEIIGKVNQYGVPAKLGLTRFYDDSSSANSTSVVITASTLTPKFGANTVFTARVTPSTATGLVNFKNGNTLLGSSTITNGVAVFVTSSLSTGSHVIKATYTGDGTYNASTSAGITVTIGSATTFITLTSSATTTKFGEEVTFTALVTSPSGTPTGTVRFVNSGTDIGTVTLVNGIAALSIRSLPISTNVISAFYSGDSNFTAIISDMVWYEVTAQPGTTPSTIQVGINPLSTSYGTTITMTATMTPLAATGTIIYRDGTTVLGTRTLTNGVASFTIRTLTAGTHNLNMLYSGNATYASASTASFTALISKLPASPSFISSTLTPSYGNSFILSTTMSATYGTPTGTVTFKEGNVVLGTSDIDATGEANFVSSNRVTVGSHTYTCVYNGDTNYNTVTSYPIVVNVLASNVAFSASTISGSAISAELGGTRDAQYHQWTIANSTIKIQSTGLPYHSYGSIDDPNTPSVQNWNKTWTYLGGVVQVGATPSVSIGTSIIGFWLNGLPMYGPSANGELPQGYPELEGFHYNLSSRESVLLNFNQGLDDAGGHTTSTGVYHYHDGNFMPAWDSGNGVSNGTITTGIADKLVIPYLNNGLVHSNGHSKILGFAADGYPVYGPFGYINPTNSTSGVQRMVSCYSLKSNSSRIGTAATNLTRYPMGIFVEDFEYTEAAGKLDKHNGRFCVTPDYPNGTYAYFITVDADSNPVFPYVIGTTFYGTPTNLG